MSDVGGRFRLNVEVDELPRRCHIVAHHRDYELLVVDLNSIGVVRPVTLMLDDGATVRGRVLHDGTMKGSSSYDVMLCSLVSRVLPEWSGDMVPPSASSRYGLKSVHVKTDADGVVFAKGWNIGDVIAIRVAPSDGERIRLLSLIPGEVKGDGYGVIGAGPWPRVDVLVAKSTPIEITISGKIAQVDIEKRDSLTLTLINVEGGGIRGDLKWVDCDSFIAIFRRSAKRFQYGEYEVFARLDGHQVQKSDRYSLSAPTALPPLVLQPFKPAR